MLLLRRRPIEIYRWKTFNLRNFFALRTWQSGRSAALFGPAPAPSDSAGDDRSFAPLSSAGWWPDRRPSSGSGSARLSFALVAVGPLAGGEPIWARSRLVCGRFEVNSATLTAAPLRP